MILLPSRSPNSPSQLLLLSVCFCGFILCDVSVATTAITENNYNNRGLLDIFDGDFRLSKVGDERLDRVRDIPTLLDDNNNNNNDNVRTDIFDDNLVINLLNKIGENFSLNKVGIEQSNNPNPTESDSDIGQDRPRPLFGSPALSVHKLGFQLNDITPRIVGGVEANPALYPFYAYIEIDKIFTSGQTGTNLCGGSLIHPNIVLTAGHCFQAEDTMEVLDVRLFVNRTSTDGSTGPEYARGVLEFIVHPDFVSGVFDSDLALLILDSDVVEIEPIVINDEFVVPPDETAVEAVGFGTLQELEPLVFPTNLQVATLQTVDIKACEAQYVTQGIAINSTLHLCAAAPNTDACQGDSGGPLLLSNGVGFVQVGVISFGIGCAEASFSGVYTRISSFVPFVQDIICQQGSDPPALCDEANSTAAPATSAPIGAATSAPAAAPVTSSPAAPGTSSPAAPSTTAPATRSPAAPGTLSPAAPGTLSPAAPSTAAPATGSPAAPGTLSPAAPATLSPAAPSTLGPAAPGTLSPAAPATTAPATVGPAAPGTLSPAAPATLSPAAPSTLGPAAPSTLSPAAPATTPPATVSPAAPGTLSPAAPATLSPAAPSTLSPAAPATTAPATVSPAAPGTMSPAAQGTLSPVAPSTVVGTLAPVETLAPVGSTTAAPATLAPAAVTFAPISITMAPAASTPSPILLTNVPSPSPVTVTPAPTGGFISSTSPQLLRPTFPVTTPTFSPQESSASPQLLLPTSPVIVPTFFPQMLPSVSSTTWGQPIRNRGKKQGKSSGYSSKSKKGKKGKGGGKGGGGKKGKRRVL